MRPPYTMPIPVSLTAQPHVAVHAIDPHVDAAARWRGGTRRSIVEPSQSQLNKTQAEIEQATAKYEYQARISALNFQLGMAR
jgi:hypothetical protein